MKTFAELEKKLKEDGFKETHINQMISQFETEKEVAYIFYNGPGKGYDMVKYPKTKTVSTQPSPEHTPAPWYVDCTDASIEKYSGYWPITTLDKELIALVNLQECKIPYNQQCANVKAIAVSGEMLDLLINAVEGGWNMDPDLKDKFINMIKKATT